MEAAPSLSSGRNKLSVTNTYYRTALTPSETAAEKCVGIRAEAAPSLAVVVESECGVGNSDVTSSNSHSFANNNNYATNVVSIVFLF